MTTENTIGLISLIVFLISQTGIFGYYLGVMRGKIKSLNEGLLFIRDDITAMGIRVEHNQEEAVELFVSKIRCNGIQEKWESRVEALLDHRDIWNEQNTVEHKSLKELASGTHERLDKLIECIHKLDKRIPQSD